MTPDQDRQFDVASRLVLTFADHEASPETVSGAVQAFAEELTNPADAFLMLWTLTRSATMAIRFATGGEGDDAPAGMLIAVQDGNGVRRIEPEEAPPEARLLGRWVTSSMNDDQDMAVALFRGIPQDMEAHARFVSDVFSVTRRMLLTAASLVAARGGGAS